MNQMIIVLIVLATVVTIAIPVFLVISLRSRAYLSYRKKLIDFETRKKRIEADIENDRKEFKHGS